MTPWSVVKAPRQAPSPRMRPFRSAVFALAALVVLSLGFALIPAERPAPAEPSLTERARAAAFADALDLRAAGMRLASAGSADPAALNQVVTLLTIQARALQPPVSASAVPGSAPPPASASASPSSTAAPRSSAELVQAMADSGNARVKDAETADGGMARLLAGTGTAQLLAARRLAAATGVPLPGGSAAPGGETPGATPGASACPSPLPHSTAEATTVPGTPADTRQALTSALAAEQQAVYGYQAALPRLAPAEAGPASEFLVRHKELAAAAEERLRLACGMAVPQQPGYVLDPGFLAAPAAGLGKLEAASLGSYGDVVALCGGQDRKWAVSALRSAAERAMRWGADPGPVPGLRLDVGQLPALPAEAGSPGGSGSPGSAAPTPAP